jgi:tetratricopeptide (TPR) repeat protein
MQIERSFWRLFVVALMVVPMISCSYLDQLSAMRTFKEANSAYGRGDYEGAVEQYEEIIQTLELASSGGDDLLNEQLTATYFYIGNSYDQLYRPARRGEVENDAYLENAIKFYQLAADEIEDFELKKLSMQYLVSVFGPSKANDPSRSEPVLRQMILLDPENPDNYFALANLYEQSGLFEVTELVMLTIKDLRPDDPVVYLQLAGFYNRSGDFDLTIDALRERARIEPDNPEAFYTISTYYWEKAFRDFRITQEQKSEYVLAGLEAADEAIGLNNRYVDALVYKNILLRMQANMTSDLDEQNLLIEQADELRDLAEQLQEEQQSGVVQTGEA